MEKIQNEAFHLGISHGVGAMRIEQAMAERKVPPLKPFVDDISSSPTMDPSTKRILIISTWRTGSSFLGELIQSAPGVFYSYEPLHFYDSHPGSKLDLIRSIFQCKFPIDYLKHVNGLTDGGQDFMRRNRRVWEACQTERSLCHRADFVGRLCSYFPIQLMKVVRLRAKEVISLLQDVDPAARDWKIVYLMRDPRGVMASRANLSWCRPDPACGQVGNLCGDMLDDLNRINQLKKQYPNQHYLLKFEDLTANVESETEKLFQFLQIPITVPVKVFLTTHTRSGDGVTVENTRARKHDDPFSTNRQSKSVASEWRRKLPAKEIENITNICLPVLKMLDYKI